MKLVIVTPAKSTTIDEVDMVNIPGSEGNFTVLRNHAPLVSATRKGVIRCNEQEIEVEGGIVEVGNNIIRIVTDK